MDVIWWYEQINDVEELMKAPWGNSVSGALKICKADLWVYKSDTHCIGKLLKLWMRSKLLQSHPIIIATSNRICNYEGNRPHIQHKLGQDDIGERKGESGFTWNFRMKIQITSQHSDLVWTNQAWKAITLNVKTNARCSVKPLQNTLQKDSENIPRDVFFCDMKF